mmetsp:Transcript_67204/g.151965  ORF Transcript_67204/g.151965 Transcript_67204/m.151965 type:complete len:184 (-) Transcript_67204:3-554(-)
MVDMMNHRGDVVSDVAYEYFGNGFSVSVGRNYNAGDEVCISYGKRSNAQLLQIYGFIEPDNSEDQYQILGLLELIDEALDGGVAPGRVKLMKDAAILDDVRDGVATAGGFVDATARAARALVATDQELAKAGGVSAAGCAALANRAGIAAGLSGSSDLDKRASKALARACKLELDRLSTSSAA